MLMSWRHRLSIRSEPLVEWLIRLCGWSAIGFVLAIFIFVFREGAPTLVAGLDLREFFTSINWRPDSVVRPQFGILALLVGTVSVTALAMAIAVPVGLGAAFFISEFCGSRARETLKIVIELLAAIPSVV
jgi:phosphate transport system permease protein